MDEHNILTCYSTTWGPKRRAAYVTFPNMYVGSKNKMNSSDRHRGQNPNISLLVLKGVSKFNNRYSAFCIKHLISCMFKSKNVQSRTNSFFFFPLSGNKVISELILIQLTGQIHHLFRLNVPVHRSTRSHTKFWSCAG